MTLQHIGTPDGVAPGNGYSHVVVGEGRLISVSGQVSVDADNRIVGSGDPDAQARQVFENLDRCLTAAGATFDDVVKLTFFTTDIAFMPALRTVRDSYVGTAGPPASSAVQVGALIHPELLVEVEAFAVTGN